MTHERNAKSRVQFTSASDRVSDREASGGEDDTLVGHIKIFGHSASAHLFQDSSSKARSFEKTSPEGHCQLAVSLKFHHGQVVQNGRLTHAGRILRGGVNLYRPGEHIAVNTRGPWEMLVLFLPDELLEAVSEEADFSLGGSGNLEKITAGFQLDTPILNASLRIAHSIGVMEPFSRFRMDLASQEIAVQVLSMHSRLGPGLLAPLQRTTAKGLARWQLSRACEAMSDLHAKDLSLATLANASQCSQTHFSRAFKASTGLPPFEWLLRRRIDKAKSLLLQSSRSLSEIALEVGFAAQPQFTTAFRRVTGESPGRWQKLNRE